jgi:transcriptional regulator with XRE-family HTH domain
MRSDGFKETEKALPLKRLARELARRVSARIRYHRLLLGLSQEDLARRVAEAGADAGSSFRTISRWENGTFPKPVSLVAISKALGVEVADLFREVPVEMPASARADAPPAEEHREKRVKGGEQVLRE